jgi:hypothetical protein
MNPFNVYWLVATLIITNPLSLMALAVRGAVKGTSLDSGFSRNELLGAHLAVFGVIALATALVAI